MVAYWSKKKGEERECIGTQGGGCLHQDEEIYGDRHLSVRKVRQLERELEIKPVLSGLLKMLADEFETNDLEFLLPRAVEEADAMGLKINCELLDALESLVNV